MRILVAHNVSRRTNGGMSRIMRRIHDVLVADGAEVDHFCSEDVPAALHGRVARFAFPWLVAAHARRAAGRGRPYDIVNVHEPVGAVIAAGKALVGRPWVVVTSHGVERRGWEIALEEHRLGRDTLAVRSRLSYPLTTLWQARLALTRADHVMCLSGQDRDFLQQRFGIPLERMTRVFPGGDAVYGTVAAGRDYGRGDRLLFFGTWLRRKGIVDVVRAVTDLFVRHPGLRLTVLGAGFPESVVRAAFPEALRSRIECPRASTEPEIAGVLARTDVHVLPSLFEGTPLTIIETMLSGMPIVTTETCGMRDVIEHERTGLLVPMRAPGEIVAAIERLIGDPNLRGRLGRAAHREALASYTWERVAELVRVAYGQAGRRPLMATVAGGWA